MDCLRGTLAWDELDCLRETSPWDELDCLWETAGAGLEGRLDEWLPRDRARRCASGVGAGLCTRLDELPRDKGRLPAWLDLLASPEALSPLLAPALAAESRRCLPVEMASL